MVPAGDERGAFSTLVTAAAKVPTRSRARGPKRSGPLAKLCRRGHKLPSIDSPLAKLRVRHVVIGDDESSVTTLTPNPDWRSPGIHRYPRNPQCFLWPVTPTGTKAERDPGMSTAKAFPAQRWSC